MIRVSTLVYLRQEMVNEYIRLHTEVWPEVLNLFESVAEARQV